MPASETAAEEPPGRQGQVMQPLVGKLVQGLKSERVVEKAGGVRS